VRSSGRQPAGWQVSVNWETWIMMKVWIIKYQIPSDEPAPTTHIMTIDVTAKLPAWLQLGWSGGGVPRTAVLSWLLPWVTSRNLWVGPNITKLSSPCNANLRHVAYITFIRPVAGGFHVGRRRNLVRSLISHSTRVWRTDRQTDRQTFIYSPDIHEVSWVRAVKYARFLQSANCRSTPIPCNNG